MGPNLTIEKESPPSPPLPQPSRAEPRVTTTHYASQPRHLAERIPFWIQHNSQQGTTLSTPISYDRRRLDGPVRALRKPLLLAQEAGARTTCGQL